MSSNESSIGRWISILYRYRQNYIGKKLEPYHIGSGQFFFLIVLSKNNGISQEELSDHLKIDKATTAKAIQKLEDEGYVDRIIDAKDKRAYQVYLTDKALKVIPIINEAVKDWERMITTGLSENESVIIEQILSKMAQNAWQIRGIKS